MCAILWNCACAELQLLKFDPTVKYFALEIRNKNSSLTTTTAFWKNGSFGECVLWDISSACVDTKLKDSIATCIVGGDRMIPIGLDHSHRFAFLE